MSSSFDSDPWLEARLRNVPLPIGFLARLSDLGDADDARLDAALSDVPLPEGFIERLLLDAKRRRRAVWFRFASAAAVFLAVGIAAWNLQDKVFGPGNPVRPDAALPLAARENDDPSAAGNDAATAGVADRHLVDPLREPLSNPPAVIEQLAPPLEVPPPVIAQDVPRAVELPSPERGPSREAIFAADDRFDAAPVLARLMHVTPRGLAVPRIRGYDQLFQLRYGDHPLVSPAADQRLASLLVPLDVRTTSFELAWRLVQSGRLPPAEEVRVEDFLAAVEYGFAPSKQESLAIRTAAGPSPLGESGLQMLQVGVRAKDSAVNGEPPIVAEKATLRVSFNPKSVALYRLLGHEAVQLTAPTEADRDFVLRAGQTATGLFEVVLKPDGEKEVATVELTWVDPSIRRSRRLAQKVSRSQFAKSFEASAPSLQAAALAAETAEALRGSYFAPVPRGLRRVEQLLQAANPKLLERPSMTNLASFIKKAEEIRRLPAAAAREVAPAD